MGTYKLSEVIAQRPNKMIYRDGNRIIKVMGSEYPACDVLSEAHNLAAVGESDLKVPRLVEVTKIEGNWAIVWEYVSGTTFEDLMKKDPSQTEKYLSRMVDLQIEMFKKDASRLPRLREKLIRKIEGSGLDATVRYELETRLGGMPKNHKLCHGDFNPSNVIQTDNGDTCIIDWSHATQGNATADAVQTYLLLHWQDGNDVRAEQYMQLFCKKTDTARQYVGRWMSIIAAGRLSKAKPDEREFLLRWANVAEY